jgi:hypothetical protein
MLAIYVNDTQIYEHDFYIHSAVDPVDRTVLKNYPLKAGQNVSFMVIDNPLDGADSFDIRGGTSMLMNLISTPPLRSEGNITVTTSTTNIIENSAWIHARAGNGEMSNADGYLTYYGGTATSTIGHYIMCDGYIRGFSIGQYSGLAPLQNAEIQLRVDGAEVADLPASTIAGVQYETADLSVSEGDIVNCYYDCIFTCSTVSYYCEFYYECDPMGV